MGEVVSRWSQGHDSVGAGCCRQSSGRLWTALLSAFVLSPSARTPGPKASSDWADNKNSIKAWLLFVPHPLPWDREATVRFSWASLWFFFFSVSFISLGESTLPQWRKPQNGYFEVVNVSGFRTFFPHPLQPVFSNASLQWLMFTTACKLAGWSDPLSLRCASVTISASTLLWRW